MQIEIDINDLTDISDIFTDDLNAILILQYLTKPGLLNKVSL